MGKDHSAAVKPLIIFLTLENDLISCKNYIFGSATFTLSPVSAPDNFVTLTRTIRNV